MRQAGFATIYLIVGLGLITVIASGIAYAQIKANGKKQARIEQLETDVIAANQAVERIRRQEQLNEVLVVDNLTKRETIYRDRDVIKYRVREVIKNAPEQDCLNSPLPDSIVRMLTDGHKAGSGVSETTPSLDDGDSNARINSGYVRRTDSIQLRLTGQLNGLQPRQKIIAGMGL